MVRPIKKQVPHGEFDGAPTALKAALV